MSTGKRISELRKKHKVKKKDFAEYLNINEKTLYYYERDWPIPSDKIEMISAFFNVPPAYIMGWDDGYEKYAKKVESEDVPIFSKIPASLKFETSDNIIGYLKIPKIELDDLNVIAYKISENSMYPRYIKDDIIIIELTSEYESGEDVFFLIDNKRKVMFRKIVKMDNGKVKLVPINPEYEEKIYSEDDIRVFGKVLELRRRTKKNN